VSPDPAVLQDLVRRVVDSVHPLRIILFGSAARGDMGPNNDLDTLVVVDGESDCRALAKILARRLRGLGCATDVLVVKQTDVEEHADNPDLVLHTALTEGKELYRATS
jgi:predicted nucleotidyltransferase